MENKKVLNIAVGLVALAALLVMVIAVSGGNPAALAPPLAAQPTSHPKVTAHATATLRPTTDPATSSPPSPQTASPIPATATPGITRPPSTPASSGGFPTITNGPQYPAKFAEVGFYIKPIAGTPIVPREDALSAMLSRGQDTTFKIVSDRQIVVNGQTILYTAYYGLVTVGYRGPNGLWAGSSLNVPISKCTVDGKCVPTGEVLDHIENRPMWLIDLEIDVPNGGATCPPAGTPCPPPRDNNHQVNLVDAQTLMFIGGADYYQP